MPTDVPITADEIVSSGLVSEAVWQQAAEKSLALFARGREIAAKNGLILVDTKYEFGLDENGQVVIADEIHTHRFQPLLEAGKLPRTLRSRPRTGQPRQRIPAPLGAWAQCDPYNDPIPEIPGDTLIDFSNRYIQLYETVTGHTFTP